MYNYSEVEKKERRKVISVATAIAVLILVLIVAIIVVATRKGPMPTADNGGENTSFEIVEDDSKDAAEPAPSDIGVISTDTAPVSNVVEEVPAAVPSTVVKTGPEDTLPLAILLGGVTAYVSSAIMKKKLYSTDKMC